jgi:hypothetical protein
VAIKGKRRSRARSGRPVAMAPRPYLVPPKTPLMRRTGTKVFLVVLLEALLFSLLVLGDAQSDADRRREEIVEFTSLVEAQLYQGGAAQQSFAGPLVLPQLGQAVAQIEGGEVELEEIQQNTESWSDVATRAGQQIGDIEVELAGLKQARNLMEQGLLLYAQLARELGVAVEIDGAARRDLLGTITEQMGIAGVIFDTGFGLLQEERRKAGLPTASSFPGGTPGDFGGLPPLPPGP